MSLSIYNSQLTHEIDSTPNTWTSKIFHCLAEDDDDQQINHAIRQANHEMRRKCLEDLCQQSDENFYLFFYALEPETKRILFNSIDIESPLFLKITQHILTSSLDQKQKNQLCVHLFSSNPKWEHSNFSTRLFHHDNETFCLLLQTIQTNELLISLFGHLNQNDFPQIIETLAKRTLAKKFSWNLPLDIFLRINKKNFTKLCWLNDFLYKKHSLLSEHAQSCFLLFSSSEARQKMAKNRHFNFSTITNLLTNALQLETNPKRAVNLLKDFLLIAYKNDQLFDLINFFKEKIEGESRAPEILALIPCALTEDTFNELFFDEYSVDVTMSILNACSVTQYTPLQWLGENLNTQNRLQDFVEKMWLSIEQTVKEDGEIIFKDKLLRTLKEFREEAKDFSNKPQEIASKLVEEYKHLLQQIPPYLLALSMIMQDYMYFVLAFIPYWSDQQLEAIGKMCSKSDLEYIIKKHPTQAGSIMKWVAPSFFTDFCERHTPFLKNILDTYQEKMSEVKAHLEALSSESTLTKAEYVATIEKISILGNIFKLPPIYNAFQWKIETENDEKNPRKKILYSPEQTTIHSSYITLKRKIRTEYMKLLQKPFQKQLKELEAKLPPETFTEPPAFSCEFLNLLTQETQDRLGLTSCLKDLEEAGIINENDLKVLGYDKLKQNTLRSIRIEILDACIDPADPQSEKPKKLWDKAFYVNTDLNESIKKFMKKYKLSSLPLDKLKTLSLRILKNLKTLHTVEKEFSFIETFNPVQFNISELALFKEHFQKLMEQAFITFYQQDIIVQLNRYLKQSPTNIKQQWIDFKKLGIHSLSDLCEKHSRQNEALFNLSTITIKKI